MQESGILTFINKMGDLVINSLELGSQYNRVMRLSLWNILHHSEDPILPLWGPIPITTENNYSNWSYYKLISWEI